MTDKKTKVEQQPAAEKVVAKAPVAETKPAAKPKAEKAKEKETVVNVESVVNKKFKQPYKQTISVAKTIKPTHKDLSLRRLIDNNISFNMPHSNVDETIDKEFKSLLMRFGWSVSQKIAIPDVMVSRYVLEDDTVIYMDDKSDYEFSKIDNGNGVSSFNLVPKNGVMGYRTFILVNSFITNSYIRYDTTQPTSTFLLNVDAKNVGFKETNVVAAGVELKVKHGNQQNWTDPETRIALNDSVLEQTTVLGRSAADKVQLIQSQIINAKVTDFGIVKESTISGGTISAEHIDILNSTINGGIKCLGRLRIHNYRDLDLKYQLIIKSLDINGKTGFSNFHIGSLPPVYVIASQKGVILQRDLSASDTDFGRPIVEAPKSIELTDKDNISIESIVRRFVKQQPIGGNERSFDIERDYRNCSKDPVTESLYNYLIDSVVSRVKVMFTVRAAEKLTQSHQYNANMDDCPF